MKTINYFFALTVTLLLAACTNSEEDNIISGNIMSFEAMKHQYGIEEAFLDQATMNNVPSVTLEEMQGVLEALRKNGNTSINCKVVDSEGNVGMTKKVQMIADYQARARSGSLLDNFSLCVSLNFIIDEGQVYYLGTDYTYASNLFCWNANGLSLAPIKNSRYYGFESTSYLFFRVIDSNNQLVRVQITFSGKYNFTNSEGTYSFALSKCDK